MIAVENSLEDGYVTEKFWQGFATGAVPVYVGDDSGSLPLVCLFSLYSFSLQLTRSVNRELLAPGAHSFVFADDFGNARDLAAHLQMLNEHDTLYERYFEWKREPFRPEFRAYQQLDWSSLACRTCRRVALMKAMGHTRADLVRLKETANRAYSLGSIVIAL